MIEFSLNLISYAFPRRARLLSAHQYTDVFKQPDLVISDGPLRIRVKKNTIDHSRLGLVISKRVFSKAVRRNRIKRLIRNRFRQEINSLPSIDLIIQLFAELDDKRLHQLLERQFLILERKEDLRKSDF